MKFIRDEIRNIRRKDPAIKNNIEVLLYPSFKAIIWYRIAHYFYLKKHYFIARYLSERTKRKTGIEIHPGATIGKDLFIDHGIGTVIGETAIVGDNVTMFHDVTLGGTGFQSGKRHPTVEDNVFIGSGSKILGNIVIGKNSRIGANAVVLKNVPSDVTVVGIPGKIKEKKKIHNLKATQKNEIKKEKKDH